MRVGPSPPHPPQLDRPHQPQSHPTVIAPLAWAIHLPYRQTQPDRVNPTLNLKHRPALNCGYADLQLLHRRLAIHMLVQ